MALVPYAADELALLGAAGYKLAKKYKKPTIRYEVPAWLKQALFDSVGYTAKSMARKAKTMGKSKQARTFFKKNLTSRFTASGPDSGARKIATDPAAAPINLSNGNLIPIRFRWPTYDNGSVNIDNLISRTRNHVFVKGIKVCQTFTARYKTSDPEWQGPLKVRWYLVQAKEGILTTDPNVLSQILDARFFKANSDGEQRERNFNNELNNPANLYDHAKVCAPVSPDNKLHIITSREFIIHGRDKQCCMEYQHTIKEWFPVKKTMKFDNCAAVLPNQEIFVVMWVYPADSVQYNPNAAIATNINYQRHDTVYWSEKP